MKREIKVSCIVGAVAGAAPLFLNLIMVDMEMLADSFKPALLVGYVIKAVGLMGLGAFVVFVNSEADLKKAFQLGLMAPAIIIGMLNGNHYDGTEYELEQIQKKKNHSIHSELPLSSEKKSREFSFINRAWAQNGISVKGEHNTLSNAKMIWYGVTGKISDSWFVVVGSHQKKSNAEKQAKAVKKKGYDARVFPPSEKCRWFRVVIGSYLDIDDAKKLKTQAVRDKISQRIYLWDCE